METIQNTLQKFGFELSTGEIYVILANNGEMSVPQILQKTTLSRASVYDSLSELLAKDYLEYRKEGRNAYYKLAHPNKLFSLIEQKKRETTLLESEMKESISSLIGAYNLSANKPGVRFFEGEEGIYDALDFLTKNFKPNTELLSFVKVKPAEQEKDLNEAVDNFIKKRIASNVKTLVLAIDTPESKKLTQNDKNALRETRLVPADNLFLDFPGGEIFIYENDVCAVTAEKNTHFALIISSPAIAQILRTFFLSEWSLLSKQT